jgi:hypothetical protein
MKLIGLKSAKVKPLSFRRIIDENREPKHYAVEARGAAATVAAIYCAETTFCTSTAASLQNEADRKTEKTN